MMLVHNKTTQEAVIIMAVNLIACKYNCVAILDFEKRQMFIDGEPDNAALALAEIERTFIGR